MRKALGEANHPPVVQINGPSSLQVKPGESINLDASGSNDPDGKGLTFQWSIYPPIPEIEKLVIFRGGETAITQVEVGSVPIGRVISILLTVKDDGTPCLTRYGRVTLRVAPAE